VTQINSVDRDAGHTPGEAAYLAEISCNRREYDQEPCDGMQLIRLISGWTVSARGALNDELPAAHRPLLISSNSAACIFQPSLQMRISAEPGRLSVATWIWLCVAAAASAASSALPMVLV